MTQKLSGIGPPVTHAGQNEVACDGGAIKYSYTYNCVKKNTISDTDCIHEKTTYLCGFRGFEIFNEILFEKYELKRNKDCDTINTTVIFIIST